MLADRIFKALGAGLGAALMTVSLNILGGIVAVAIAAGLAVAVSSWFVEKPTPSSQESREHG